jgi:hypothetical protein
MVYGIRCTVYEIRCMEMLMVFGKRYVINGECFMADPSAPNSEAHNLKHVHISWSRSETVSKIIAQGFNLVSGAPPWLPRDFALSANQRHALPMEKSWPSKMRKKTACIGWYGELFRSGSIDQNRSSVNWPLAKVLQRHGDAETGFKGL